ncbi:MAG TPA: transcriptional regulator [Dokdonella sp.]
MTLEARVGDVLALDRLVHEPARLLILTVLASAKQVEFTFLEKISGLSKGNLSSHMSKLEAAGLIEVTKRFRGKRPLTELSISAAGRHALAEYRRRLASVVGDLPDDTAAAPKRR